MTVSTQAQPSTPDALFKHFQTPKSGLRLNQIESIRANGVGDIVALPQLCVCGDQSSGKSSVLEGITGIPFPRQEGLCTRFPTEITLRHSGTSTSTIITASIRPHPSRTPDVQRTLSAYRKIVQTMSELPSIIDDVSRLMQLRGYMDNDTGHAFASDVLRVEITGPIGLYLSIVDLPGLISVPNEEQTQDDVDAVHDMARTYLQSSRTIILTVLQAGNDMANQPVIRLAREYDPDGQRTVGIITKPDLINEGAESKIALVAKNQDNIKLRLGFFLLKNPTPSELKDGITMETRADRELRFFSRPPWDSQGLDPGRIGAGNLRLFLQELLDSHIERELPKVLDEVKKILEKTQIELDSIGVGRPTLGHIRSYLTQLSMSFYELSRAALDGNYNGSDSQFFSDDHECRLRARLQAMNNEFAQYMRVHGQRRKIGEASPECQDLPEGFLPTPELRPSTPQYKLADEKAQIIVRNAEMMTWVQEVYTRTRGKELPGNHNAALLCELFNEQSGRWREIAQSHIDEVISFMSRWIRQAVQRLIKEDKLSADIQAILVAWLDLAGRSALDELNKIMGDEQRGPLTYNHYYTDNVQKSRLTDQRAAIRQAISLVAQHDWHGKLHISNHSDELEKFVSRVESRIEVDMDKQACKEALTQLQAYYKVAMKTFVDNVARQVIERHIVCPLPHAFDPGFVARLSDDEITRIGSEPETQAQRREKLEQVAASLRQTLLELRSPLA